MRIVIIEDEAPAFRRLQKIIEDVIQEAEIIEVFDSVQSSVAWFKQNPNADLVFMDIQLSDGLSFEIFDQVSVQIPIIFTTAFDEYLLEAFKVNSIDYLLKPVKKEELEKSMVKFSQLKNMFSEDGEVDSLQKVLSGLRLGGDRFKKRYLVKNGGKLLSIPTDTIAHFYLKRGVLHLTTFDQKTFILDHTLEEVRSQIDPSDFYRANRQFIINFKFIRSAEKYHKGKIIVETSFDTEEPITISEEKASHFKNWLDQ